MTAPPGAARLFDVHLESDLRSDDDLRNLGYFGVTDAVLLLHDAMAIPAARGEDDDPAAPALPAAARRLRRLVEREPGRLRSAGIRPHLAPGIPPGYAAMRGVAETLALLPAFVDAPGVVAVGGVGLDQDTPLERRLLQVQLELASDRGLPVLACLPSRDRPASARRVAAAATRAGVPAARLLFAHANLPALRQARRLGAHAALGVHPGDLDPTRAAAIVARHGAEGLCLGAMLGAGPGDVLALMRIGRALALAGVSDATAARALHANAAGFLGLDPPSF